MPSRFKIGLAARVVRAGGVIAYPTEAVFGLGCNPDDPAAVSRITSLKQRSPEAGYILIASHMDQLEQYIAIPDSKTLKRITANWPGPVTWVVPAAATTPDWITGGRDVVAIRVTAHPVAAALCDAAERALISTSANRHGQAPARTRIATVRRFGLDVDMIVGGVTGSHGKPTEIRDACSNEILRAAT